MSLGRYACWARDAATDAASRRAGGIPQRPEAAPGLSGLRAEGEGAPFTDALPWLRFELRVGVEGVAPGGLGGLRCGRAYRGCKMTGCYRTMLNERRRHPGCGGLRVWTHGQPVCGRCGTSFDFESRRLLDLEEFIQAGCRESERLASGLIAYIRSRGMLAIRDGDDGFGYSGGPATSPRRRA